MTFMTTGMFAVCSLFQLTSGIAGSTTTFSSWMLEGYQAFANADYPSTGGLHDVS